MAPEEILKQYEKGCGCAESKPSDCRECFDAAVRAIVAYKDAELAALRAEDERLREALREVTKLCHWNSKPHQIARKALK